MPKIGLRVWGEYVGYATLDPETDNNLDVKFQEGMGFRLGTGFRFYSLSLNLEYEQIAYDKSHLEKIGPFTTNTTFDDVELSSKAWIASVSFPIEI
jgi:hypothetical protein